MKFRLIFWVWLLNRSWRENTASLQYFRNVCSKQNNETRTVRSSLSDGVLYRFESEPTIRHRDDETNSIIIECWKCTNIAKQPEIWNSAINRNTRKGMLIRYWVFGTVRYEISVTENGRERRLNKRFQWEMNRFETGAKIERLKIFRGKIASETRRNPSPRRNSCLERLFGKSQGYAYSRTIGVASFLSLLWWRIFRLGLETYCLLLLFCSIHAPRFRSWE